MNVINSNELLNRRQAEKGIESCKRKELESSVEHKTITVEICHTTNVPRYKSIRLEIYRTKTITLKLSHYHHSYLIYAICSWPCNNLRVLHFSRSYSPITALGTELTRDRSELEAGSRSRKAVISNSTLCR